MKNWHIKKIVILTICIILILPSAGAEEYSSDIKQCCNDFAFDMKVKLYMKICQMPSLTAIVVKNDSVVWSKAYGYSCWNLRKKASLDTIYLLGSITKSVTATALMQLYEKGLFNLDENISKYLSFDLKNPKYPDINITFRMLLAHQSSICEDFRKLICSYPYPDNASEWIKENLIPGGKKYKEKIWADYAPGENVTYSSVGFMILGHLLEKISGQNIEEYCKENIFGPLQMYNTSFKIKYYKRKNLAKPYFPILSGLYVPLFNYDLNCANSFGGLRTNIEDISHFLIAHMNNGTYNGIRILNESTINLMHTIQYSNIEKGFYGYELRYGLGWIKMNISNDIYGGYNGGAVGYMCNMMVRESDNTGVIFMANGHFKRMPFFTAKIRLSYYINLGLVLLEKAE